MPVFCPFMTDFNEWVWNHMCGKLAFHTLLLFCRYTATSVDLCQSLRQISCFASSLVISCILWFQTVFVFYWKSILIVYAFAGYLIFLLAFCNCLEPNRCLALKLNLIFMILMFVMLLLVPVDHELRDCVVSPLSAIEYWLTDWLTVCTSQEMHN